jgi:hypothetical protein
MAPAKGVLQARQGDAGNNQQSCEQDDVWDDI